MSNSSTSSADWTALVVCTLAWSTTWYAITLQLGSTPSEVSVVWRFALAAVLLAGYCVVRQVPLSLTRAQWGPVLGVGVAQFAIQYPLVYFAESRIASGVVAVIFAALSFVNLVAFAIAFRQRASWGAWIASVFGLAGVAFLSGGEFIAGNGRDVIMGLSALAVAIVSVAVANVFARHAELEGVPVPAMAAWGMGLGAFVLACYVAVRGIPWRFNWSATYLWSLLYLSVVGSVIAFLLYYGLARRRGFALASYISALTPPLAMAVSTIFEGKTWSPWAFLGVALVLAGQAILLRVRREA